MLVGVDRVTRVIRLSFEFVDTVCTYLQKLLRVEKGKESVGQAA